MAGFASNTEQQAVNYVRSLFTTSLQGSIPALDRNNVNITAVTLGGVLWELAQEVKLGIDARVMPDTAVGEALDRLGALANVFRETPTLATGAVYVTGPNGTTLEGTIERCDGVIYDILGPAVPPADDCTTVRVCDLDVCPSSGLDTCGTFPATIVNGEAWLWVQAQEEGAAGNYPAGTPLEDFATGVTVEVGPGGLTGGGDTEADRDFRVRVINGWPGPQRAGSYCDLRDEALLAPGVTRAWVRPCCDIAKIYFVMDTCYDDSGPQADDVQRLTEYFEDECRRPLTGTPDVCAACVQNIDLQLTCIKGTICTIADIETALRAWLISNADLGETVLRDDIVAAIKAVCPGFSFSLPQGDFVPKSNGVFTTATITVV